MTDLLQNKREIGRKEIHVGIEGRKWIITLQDNTTRQISSVFCKTIRVSDIESIKNKYAFLKNLGIPVPKGDFIELNREHYFIAEDLSENGRNLVLSSNNPEIEDPKILRRINSINLQTKQNLINILIDAAIQAANFNSPEKSTKYSFSPPVPALILPMHQTVEKSKISIMDLGIDIRHEYFKESHHVLQESLTGIIIFTSMVLQSEFGRDIFLPDRPELKNIDKNFLYTYSQ